MALVLTVLASELTTICANTQFTLYDDPFVIGVVYDENDPNSARAYPVEILDRHEIVNDFQNNESYAVTWSPLTATHAVFYTQTLYSYVFMLYIFAILAIPFTNGRFL